MSDIGDNLIQAMQDTRGEGNSLADEFPLVGITDEEATELTNDMVMRGYLPAPTPTPEVTGLQAIQLHMMGVVIGLRAAQLVEVAKLEQIESLGDSV